MEMLRGERERDSLAASFLLPYNLAKFFLSKTIQRSADTRAWETWPAEFWFCPSTMQSKSGDGSDGKLVRDQHRSTSRTAKFTGTRDIKGELGPATDEGQTQGSESWQAGPVLAGKRGQEAGVRPASGEDPVT